MKKPRGIDAAATQAMIDHGMKIAGPHTVQQDAHFDTAGAGRDQGIGENVAGLVIAKDIRGHRHGFLRARDRRQHFRIGRVAALQHRKRIAGGERAAGDMTADLEQVADIFGRIRRLFRAGGAGLGVANLPIFRPRLVTRLMPNK